MSERAQALEARILDYLANGGLFNPELMNHDAVRDLVMDLRGHISRTQAAIRAAVEDWRRESAAAHKVSQKSKYQNDAEYASGKQTAYEACADALEKLLVEAPAEGVSPQLVQRFDLVSVNFAYTSDHEMERADDGEWVRFDDVFPPAPVSAVEPTPEPPTEPQEMFYMPPSVTRRRAEKAEAMVEQLEGNIARQAGFMLAQDEKVVALQAEIERLSAKYNDAHLRALKAEAGAPAPCVWREKYHELLLAVGTKYPGESRHETALRYIQQAEAGPNDTAGSQPLKVER